MLKRIVLSLSLLTGCGGEDTISLDSLRPLNGDCYSCFEPDRLGFQIQLGEEKRHLVGGFEYHLRFCFGDENYADQSYLCVSRRHLNAPHFGDENVQKIVPGCTSLGGSGDHQILVFQSRAKHVDYCLGYSTDQ